jgi:hypothetical protein
MAEILSPLINGLRYDYSSAKFMFNGKRYSGIKSLSYKHSVDPGKVRGTRSQVIGTTRGEYNAEGSFEMYKAEYLDFIKDLTVGNTKGYLESFFDFTAVYEEMPSSRLVNDVGRGCRLTSAENSHSEGSDGLFVRCDILIMYLIEDGNFPLSPGQFLK